MYALGHIQSSVESMGKKIDDFITESKSGFKDLNDRVNNLEDSKVRFMAITSTLGTVGGLIAGLLVKVFGIG